MARGRTVVLGARNTVTLGEGDAAKKVTTIKRQSFGPGATVELPEDEDARLTKLGFLRGDAPEMTPSAGPDFSKGAPNVVRPV